MVPFQEAAWISTIFADDADSTRAAKPESIPEGKSYFGQPHLLDRDLHRSKFVV